MKKIFFAAALLAIAGACAEMPDAAAPETPDTPEVEAVNFEASFSPVRTSSSAESDGTLKTFWTSGDKLGIFALSGSELLGSDIQYSAVQDGASSSFEAVSETVNWKDGSSSHDFYAYYPFAAAVPADAVPFVLPAVQTQAAAGDASHIAAADLLYARAEGLTKSASVKLDFLHAFAVLELDVTSTLADSRLTEISASFADGAMAGEGTLNLYDCSLSTLPESSVTLNLASEVTLSETPAKFYMLVAPGHAGSELTITLTVNGEAQVYKRTPSKAIEAGQKAVLPISAAPAKRAYGIRESSREVLWAKNLKDIAGVVDPTKVNGLAVSHGKLLLSEWDNTAPVYLDALTGEQAGTMDISSMTVATGNTQYYATSDDSGNILFCTHWRLPAPAATETIYKSASVTDAPTSFGATRGISSKSIAGWKFSVSGSVSTNAIISMPIWAEGYGTLYLVCWQVSAGKLAAGNWYTNLGTMTRSNYPSYSDAIYAGEGKYSDIFYTTYEKNADGNRYLYRYGCIDNTTVSGTFEVKGKIQNTSASAHENSVDHIVFNNASYVATTIDNPFEYNVTGANTVRMFDMQDGTFSKTVSVCKEKEFANGTKATHNSNGFSDVLFSASEDGNYLYVYIMFANNQVACVRYDCFED